MHRPATLSRPPGNAPPRSTSVKPPAPPPKPRPAGTDEAALNELRQAAFTYDYLRAKNDPVQFWETLRLARNRRAFDESTPLSPALEQSVRHELELIRRQHSAMVENLRRFLRPLSGLPEPQDRFEMALAFLLASSREHQAIAKWLAEPGKHEAKAAEKLRSLAAITDPYREALKPWTLQVPAPVAEPEPLPLAEFTEVEPAPPPSPAPAAAPAAPEPGLDPALLEALRQAGQCREILGGLYLEAELWEAMLLATRDPERTRATLEVLAQDAESELLEELQMDAEALFAKVTEQRSAYVGWVSAARNAFADKQGAAFEVILALAVSAPATREQMLVWVENPSAHRQDWVEMMEQGREEAEAYLKASGIDSSAAA
jgi:hypothetical protein